MSLDTRQIERDVEAAVGADTASIAERVRDAAAELARASSSLAWSQVEGGMKTLLNQADLFASLAAGVLRGIADRLQSGDATAGAPPAARPTPERNDAPD